MATAGDIVNNALRLAGIASDENAATPVQMQSGIDALNGWLAAQGTTIQTRVGTQRLMFTLTGATITFGTGGDVPTRIQGAGGVFITIGNIDYPLMRMSIEDYEQIPFKSVGGIPSVYCLDNGYPLNTMRLYPVPTSSAVLNVDAVVPMGEYSNPSDVVALPPDVRRAAAYGLALELCASYGTDPSPMLLRLADESLKQMRRAYRIPAQKFDNVLPGVSTYNVRRDNGALM